MTNRLPSLGTSLLVGLIALLLAAPASALAADTFVDQAKGDNANTCLTPLDACKHIQAAVSISGPGDTIHVADPVAPTTYDESIILSEGRSLVAESPNPNETIIGSLATSYTLTVDGTGAGTISGFTIRGGTLPVLLDGPAVIDGNVLDQSKPPTYGTRTDVQIGQDAGDAEVTNNAFSDSVQDAQTAINSNATGSPLIAGNTINGFNVGVVVIGGGGTPRIVDNDISGVHGLGSIGSGILVRDQDARVSRNHLQGAAAAGTTTGISIDEFQGAAATGAELSRNQVFGHQYGIWVEDTEGPVSLSSDLVAKSTIRGLSAWDKSGDGGGDVKASNVTLYDSTADAVLDGTSLKVDSSIVEGPIDALSGATCEITFSRGPTNNGNACESFQTTANPTFVNPASYDYRLGSGSPMIDAGNPAPPPDGSRDLNGDPRMLDGNNSCPDRRDIGADEFVPASPSSCPPDTTITSPPVGTTTDTTPTFEFAASEPDATFECSVDGGPFGPCSGPGKAHTVPALGGGQHTFAVRATDASALTDPTPALESFTVDVPAPPPGPDPDPGSSPDPGPQGDDGSIDTTAPNTSITKHPPNVLQHPTAAFRFASSEQGSTFRCKLDRGPFRDCRAPKRYRKLDPGKHRFLVRATDAVGNVDASAARDTFRVGR